MMDAQSLPHRKERGIFPVSEQYLRPLHPTRRLASLRERAMAANVPISSSVIPNSTACRHLAMMLLLVRSNTNEVSTNSHRFHGCLFHGIGRLVHRFHETNHMRRIQFC